MFEQSLVESAHAGSHKPASVLVSLGLQGGLIAAAAIFPLLHNPWLPLGALASVPPLPLLAPPPLPPPIVAVRRVPSTVSPAALLVPITQTVEDAPAAAPAAPTLSASIGLDPGMFDSTLPIVGPPISAVAPKPPALEPAANEAPLTLGGEVAAARCLRCPPPEYPALARRARIEGPVELRARIAADGSISQLELVRGNAMLALAAENAVRGWHYAPLLLNGRPIAVDTVITVIFSLGNEM